MQQLSRFATIASEAQHARCCLASSTRHFSAVLHARSRVQHVASSRFYIATSTGCFPCDRRYFSSQALLSTTNDMWITSAVATDVESTDISTNIPNFSRKEKGTSQSGRRNSVDVDSVNDYEKVTTSFLNRETTPIGCASSDLICGVTDAVDWWLGTKSQKGVSMAIDIIQRLIEEQIAGNTLVNLKIGFINHVLTVARFNGGEKFPEKLENILARLEEGAYQNSHPTNVLIHPTDRTYKLVIDMIARSASKDIPQKIESILNRMQQLRDDGDKTIHPDTVCYNQLLDAWSKQSYRHDSSTTDAAEHAERILFRMQKLYHEGKANVKPNAVSFNSVINVWAKSQTKTAAHRAEAVLRLMQNLYDDNDDHTVKPNYISFTSVIDAWSNSSEPEAADKAEEILNLMQELYASGNLEVKPSVVTYNAVVKAFSKRNNVAGAERAEKLLRYMYDQNKAGIVDIHPDTITYTAVINAWSKSGMPGAARKAHALLHEMLNQQEAGNTSVAPDTMTYNAVLRAIANDFSCKGKATEAESLLKQMESSFQNNNEGVKPDIMSYNLILQSCARTFGNKDKRRNALRVAADILTKIRKSTDVEPDTYTFRFFFQACRNLATKPDREKLIKAAFLFCCESGQFSSDVLFALKRAASSGLWRKLLKVDDSEMTPVLLSHLPTNWSRNVGQNKVNDSMHRSFRTRRRHDELPQKVI